MSDAAFYSANLSFKAFYFASNSAYNLFIDAYYAATNLSRSFLSASDYYSIAAADLSNFAAFSSASDFIFFA